MDFCVDCNRMLRDNYCRTCRMIYDFKFESSLPCKRCGHRMIKPQNNYSKIRYQCNYCNIHYFFEEHFQDDSTEWKEFLQSIERKCEECKGRVLVNHASGELTCTSCGLICERPLVKMDPPTQQKK